MFYKNTLLYVVFLTTVSVFKLKNSITKILLVFLIIICPKPPPSNTFKNFSI